MPTRQPSSRPQDEFPRVSCAPPAHPLRNEKPRDDTRTPMPTKPGADPTPRPTPLQPIRRARASPGLDHVAAHRLLGCAVGRGLRRRPALGSMDRRGRCPAHRRRLPADRDHAGGREVSGYVLEAAVGDFATRASRPAAGVAGGRRLPRPARAAGRRRRRGLAALPTTAPRPCWQQANIRGRARGVGRMRPP